MGQAPLTCCPAIEMFGPTLEASDELENFLAASWGPAFPCKFT
jgi:hypothetical protein